MSAEPLRAATARLVVLGCTSAEIARVIGRPAGTVRRWLCEPAVREAIERGRAARDARLVENTDRLVDAACDALLDLLCSGDNATRLHAARLVLGLPGAAPRRLPSLLEAMRAPLAERHERVREALAARTSDGEPEGGTGSVS